MQVHLEGGMIVFHEYKSTELQELFVPYGDPTIESKLNQIVLNRLVWGAPNWTSKLPAWFNWLVWVIGGGPSKP